MTSLAFVPAAPLLVREVGVGQSDDLDGWRAESVRAVRDALVGASRAVVVAGGEASRLVAGPVVASMRGFGVDLEVGQPGGSEVGWQAGIGLWLLGEVGWSGPVSVVEVAAGSVSDAAGAVGEALAEPGGSALVVVADGSAGRGPKAPGYIIDGSEEFDDHVVSALEGGDAARLAALDLREGARVMSAGAPVWAAVGAGVGSEAFGAEVRQVGAPFGVSYAVAVWLPQG